MAKRAFLIHGWGGKPGGGFRPWLKKELEKRGYQVETFAMPESETPQIEKWVPFLVSNITSPDEETVIIGHSMGAVAALLYLQKLSESIKIDKVILIAGSFKKINELTPAKKLIAKPWFQAELDYEKIKNSAKSIIAFYSDDDPWVPIENAEIPKKLGAKIIIEHNMRHYNEEAGIKEVPDILKEIISE